MLVPWEPQRANMYLPKPKEAGEIEERPRAGNHVSSLVTM
jgi:hypothetical protein